MRYIVKAVTPSRAIEQIEVEASSELHAHKLVEARGFTVVAIDPDRMRLKWRLQHSFPLPIFCQELHTLLSAGLSLVESLEALSTKESHEATKSMLQDVLGKLRQGQPLSLALETYPDQFPDLFIAMVRTSETTGDLPVALSRYVSYWEQTDKVRSKIINSAMYPAVIAIVGIAVGFFLLFYVVPRFAVIYDDIHGNMPTLSRLLMEWGRFVGEHGFITVMASILVLVGASMLLGMPDVRRKGLVLLLQVPAFRERSRVYQLSRLYRTLGMLLQGGIPIMQSLHMVSGLVDAELRVRLMSAASRIREGHMVSAAMEEYGMTTPVALKLLRVGEKTGHLGEMMDRVAVFHDQELARWIDWFTRLFEPVLMALIGVGVGVVVILMYMPIFELAGNLQ